MFVKSIGLPELMILCCVGLVVLSTSGSVVYFLKGKPGRHRRPCPYCAEMILAEATVCRFCGRDVPSEGGLFRRS
jgi:hypothetical protein